MFQPSSSTSSTNFYDNSGTLHRLDPSPSLFPSYFLHRSNSSHSLTIPDFYHEPIRRILSAGDLQCMNGSFSPAESPLLADVSAATGKVGRYSAEERRERIERYRSKRNQRNFHKKITYACRKTLADSRLRVREGSPGTEKQNMKQSTQRTASGAGNLATSTENTEGETAGFKCRRCFQPLVRRTGTTMRIFGLAWGAFSAWTIAATSEEKKDRSVICLNLLD
ncbi:hypothetical protein HPP92_019296 [Vanilla planifolia]|uniref:CCT domain-containing protein n=1 Tax=Vanilla planifolia TaxID=51239 RepID=A0A835QC77_VANPL|nr:hypothetical protein HPP92_019296 [Vanilla planifolia]